MNRSTMLMALLSITVSGCAVQPIVLDARALYGGFDARRVLLDEAGGTLALDARAAKLGKRGTGIIVTDPVAIGPTDGVLDLPATVRSVRIAVEADVPGGATVAAAARSGDNPLDFADWSPWQKLDALTGGLSAPVGRYVQVRLALTAKSADALPAVRRITLTPETTATAAWAGRLKVTAADVREIVRSPIDFKYERPDEPALAKFRSEAKLDEVVAGIEDDFERMVKLMDWAGSCKNMRGTKRERAKNGSYAWDIGKVFRAGPDGPEVYGHCMSFAEVLVTAFTAMGYVGSRHMADDGFRDMSHEIVDAWVPSLGKWVHFDPSLATYYFDKKTKTPLNLIEMHKIVADTFVPEGKDMFWWTRRGESKYPETYARVRKIGGKTPIGCRQGGWRYGEKMSPDYDWGWKHGYLAAGFVQMTPRNDYHSHPEAVSRKWEHLPGYDNFPFWVDAKTPPKRGVSNWYTRMRDFYWTLDQAAFRLAVDAKTDGLLHVKLGQSMPFFATYRITVDGGKPRDVAGPTFAWQLKAGQNRLHVAPVDEFGKVGLASSVTVAYSR